MIGVAERIVRLEDEVQQLQTWAGPGQIQALLDGQRELRSDMAKLQGTADRHERLLVGLKSDVADLKVAVAEILRRLPAR
jgi:hypothetical protein